MRTGVDGSWARLRARWNAWWHAVRSPSADAIGRRGERAAVRLLRREGYRILARRLRTRGGEIDVLALDGETLAIVEVKTSRACGAAGPSRRVDARKRRRLGTAWASLSRRPDLARRPRRLDVVAVVLEGRRARGRLYRGFAPLSRGWDRS
jgi:putative endonuclease